MSVSRDALVPRVRDMLNDQPFTTTTTTTGTGNTVTVPDGTIWSEGDVLEWQTGDFEQALVTADPVGNDLPVSRGYGGTAAETHASGDRIVQNPSFYGRQIQQALSDGIRNLWPHVYGVEEVTLNPAGDGTDPEWWDLTVTGTPVGLVSVSQVWGDSPRLRKGAFGVQGGLRVRLELESPSGLVGSGHGLYLPRLYHPTNPVTVLVQVLVTGTSDIEDDGHFPVADYLTYFAAGRLVQALEIPRVSVGADLESTGTVNTGSRLQTGSFYSGVAKQRLDELAYKYRMHWRPVQAGSR